MRKIVDLFKRASMARGTTSMGSPTRERGQRIKGFLKSPVVALIAIAAVAVPAVVLFRPEAKGISPTAASPSPTPAASASASPSKPFGTAIAAVEYTDGRGRVIAMLDANGSVRKCIKGTEHLAVSAARDGSVLYSDRQAIWEIPLACNGTPRLVKDVKALVGRAPTSEETLTNAMISPDGTRVVAILGRCPSAPTHCESLTQDVWFGKRDGSGWQRLETHPSISGWADATHLVATDGGDEFAIDVTDRSQSMFRSPQAYPGSISPDGQRCVYVLPTSDGGPFSLMLQIQLSDPKRPTELSKLGDLDPGNQAAWAPSGSRFISSADGDGVALIFDRNGKSVGKAQVGTQGTLHGWLDDGHLWAERTSVIDIIDARFGIPGTTASLPDWGETAGGDRSTRVHANYASVSAPSTAKLVAKAGDLPLHREPTLGLSFRLPLEWSVGECRGCDPPYRSTRALLRSRPAVGEQSPHPLTFGTTADSVTNAVNAIQRYHRFDPEHPESSGEEGASLNRSSLTVGSVRFEQLNFHFPEGAVSYLIGRVGARTLIMQPTYDFADPYMRAVIGSMRFN